MTRLVFTGKTVVHRQCVKVDPTSLAGGATWSSFFFGPEEGNVAWTEEPDAWDAILSSIASDCLSEGSIVYGVLDSIFSDERRDILREVRVSNASYPRGLMEKVRSALSSDIFVEGTRRDLPRWYRTYGGWMITPWWFIASSSRLDEWERELSRVRRRRVSKEILSKVELVLFNHFDHGIEVMSTVFKQNTFQAIAKSVAKEFNLPLKIQDFGNPFGNSLGISNAIASPSATSKLG